MSVNSNLRSSVDMIVFINSGKINKVCHKSHKEDNVTEKTVHADLTVPGQLRATMCADRRLGALVSRDAAASVKVVFAQIPATAIIVRPEHSLADVAGRYGAAFFYNVALSILCLFVDYCWHLSSFYYYN